MTPLVATGEQLGVEHIGAYSPQARGRSERAFQTLQDRLVKELTLLRELTENARFIIEGPTISTEAT